MLIAWNWEQNLHMWLLAIQFQFYDLFMLKKFEIETKHSFKFSKQDYKMHAGSGKATREMS